MKKIFIIIVVIALIGLNIVSIYVAYQRYKRMNTSEVVVNTEFPNPLNKQAESKPSTFLGDMRIQKISSTPSPTPLPKSPEQLMKALKQILDGGDAKAEMNAVEKQILEF